MLLYLPDSLAIFNLLPQTTRVSLCTERSGKVQRPPLTTLFSQKSCFKALFLVQLGAWSVHLSDNVGHSCLEKVE